MPTPLDLPYPWRRYTYLLHGIGWAGYLAAIVLLWGLGAVESSIAARLRFFSTVGLILPGIFYLNSIWLIPHFFQRRQWMKWFLSHLSIVGFIVLHDVLIAGMFGESALLGSIWPALQSSLGWVVLITSIAFIYRYLIDGIAMPMRMERLQAEKDTAELAFLKSQVDPHFLFNTLNTLYALALDEEAPQTADSIALLGRLMRYSLHDAQTDVITLEKEVQYLETYVTLQRLRALPHAAISFDVTIPLEKLQALHIAPMLLIPFVENAFKYGVHPSKATTIDILLAEDDAVLSMQCTNTIARLGEEHESGNVGYKNVKQRLAHVYPGAHTLHVDATEQRYRVNLEVKL